MCTEDVWRFPDGSDYGSLLARDFGVTPLYVRYNSGRSIKESGADLAQLLEALCTKPDPVDDIVLLGFSMGGLLIRSATHLASAAEMSWLPRVRRAFYVATPHLGSPWERAGRVLTKVLRAVPDPYTRLAADLGDLRSAGIKDLGDPAHPFPLVPQIEHYLVAGVSDLPLATFFGDGIVPLASGTDGACAGRQALPPEHVRIVSGLSHMQLAHHPDVYAHIKDWCDMAMMLKHPAPSPKGIGLP
jgi:pimeloyl-ACP methyl ester carboxylesterase